MMLVVSFLRPQLAVRPVAERHTLDVHAGEDVDLTAGR